MTAFVEGEHLTFAEDVHGVCEIEKGDQAIYLGHNQARIISGPSKDWLVTLTIMAPVKAGGERKVEMTTVRCAYCDWVGNEPSQAEYETWEEWKEAYTACAASHDDPAQNTCPRPHPVE